MSFLAQNWPILLFAGAMIYMHLFMHRGHHRHRHHDHAAKPPQSGGDTGQAGSPAPEQPEPDRHRHVGC